MEGSTAPQTPETPRFSVILESKLRQHLRREKLSHKKGKSRKLNKHDEAEIEEELVTCRFNAERIRKQALEEAYGYIQQEEQRQAMLKQMKANELQEEVNSQKRESVEQVVAETVGENLAASVADKVVE